MTIQDKITPSTNFMQALKEKATASGGTPASQRGYALFAYGYKVFFFDFEDQGHTAAVMHATDATTVELQSLISYPDRKGHGKQVLNTLCQLADGCGVTLWLNAYPYGRNRQQIPVCKLMEFYRRFGFVAPHMRKPWVNDYHRFERDKFERPMVREPLFQDKLTAPLENETTPVYAAAAA